MPPNQALPILFIDKLTISIPLNVQRSRDVTNNVIDSSERWCDHIALSDQRRLQYAGRFEFTTSNGKKASINLQPDNPKKNYFRLEYSPNNFGAEGRTELGAYLRDVLGDSYLDDVRGARLSRLDISFDVRGTPLNSLLIRDWRGNKSAIIRGRNKKPETYYLPYQSTNQLCVYDKLQEAIDKEIPLPPDSDSPWVRFEYRYTKLSRHTLGNIVGRLENPFNNFEVKQFSEIDFNTTNPYLRMFFDACRLVGVDSALEGIPDPTVRAQFALAYQNFATPTFWRRRTSIWAGLRNAIQNALPV